MILIIDSKILKTNLKIENLKIYVQHHLKLVRHTSVVKLMLWDALMVTTNVKSRGTRSASTMKSITFSRYRVCQRLCPFKPSYLYGVNCDQF